MATMARRWSVARIGWNSTKFSEHLQNNKDARSYFYNLYASSRSMAVQSSGHPIPNLVRRVVIRSESCQEFTFQVLGRSASSLLWRKRATFLNEIHKGLSLTEAVHFCLGWLGFFLTGYRNATISLGHSECLPCGNASD